MKWVWSRAVDFLTRFWAIICQKIENIPKNSIFDRNFFFKMKFETSPGVSKSKIWDILGNFDHNLALKKGCKKEVYCRF